MPTLANSEHCCGCAACFSICSVNAISMKPNKGGFLFPEIDESKCINCHKCEKACPAINNTEIKEGSVARAFIIQHKDLTIRSESTSGGAFSAIAEEVINEGGVVFGVVLDKNYVAHHQSFERIEDLALFRNSKYVQSEIRDTFKKCKEFLYEGRVVCYSGTPCQIQGLLNYLGKDYENLLTIDIVCHSVPSPLIFKKYIKLQKHFYPKMEKLIFRDKYWGYSYSSMTFLDDESNCIYRRGSEYDLWYRAFLPGLCDRHSCKECIYQKWPRRSDITVWDCFDVYKYSKEFDDDKGTTSVIAWNEKGISYIKNDGIKAKVKEIPVDGLRIKVIRKNKQGMSVNEDEMYEDAESLNSKQFFEKYLPVTFKVKVRYFGKQLLNKTGAYRFVQKIVHKREAARK